MLALSGEQSSQIVTGIWDYPSLVSTGVIVSFGADIGLEVTPAGTTRPAA